MVTAALALALREWSVDIATVLMRMRGSAMEESSSKRSRSKAILESGDNLTK
jgi:hypothetical protein